MTIAELDIRTVATRFAQRIGFLRKACPFLDPPGRLATYRGFVRPTMEYCPLVWMGEADTQRARLDRVQHHALKLISSGTAIDSLAVRRSVAGLTLLYKLHYKLSPPALLSVLPSPAPEPRLRSLELSSAITNIVKRCSLGGISSRATTAAMTFHASSREDTTVAYMTMKTALPTQRDC